PDHSFLAWGGQALPTGPSRAWWEAGPAVKHPGNCGGSLARRLASGEGESWVMSRPRKYPPELWDRGVRMVEESGRPIAHVARDLGITSEVLRKRVRQAEADRGERPVQLTTSEREELRSLRREVSQLRRANAILKDATAYFAAELDPTRQRWPPTSSRGGASLG